MRVDIAAECAVIGRSWAIVEHGLFQDAGGKYAPWKRGQFAGRLPGTPDVDEQTSADLIDDAASAEWERLWNE